MVKVSAKIKIAVLIISVLVALLFFDKRLEEKTVWFLMKVSLYVFLGSLAIFAITAIAKEIFIRTVKIKDKEENERE